MADAPVTTTLTLDDFMSRRLDEVERRAQRFEQLMEAANARISRSAQQAGSMYDRMGGAIERAGQRAGAFARNAAQGVNTLISSTAKYTSLVGGFVGGAGALLVRQGIKLNSDMERYSNTLRTVTGSQARANSLISWIIRFAEKTPFQVQGLVESSTQLEALGLSARKWIPLIGDVGAAFGGSQEKIDRMIFALKELNAGYSGRAIMSLGALGITRRDLEREGAQFNKGNKLTSSTDDAMGALERVIQGRFGGLMERQSKTLSGVLSNIRDMFTNTLRDTTGPLFEYVTHKANDFLSTLNRMRDSGQLAAISRALGGDLRSMGERFGNLGGRIGNAFMAGGLGGAFTQLWEEARGPAEKFIGWFASTLVDAAKWALKTLWETPQGQTLVMAGAASKWGPAALGAGVPLAFKAAGWGVRAMSGAGGAAAMAGAGWGVHSLGASPLAAGAVGLGAMGAIGAGAIIAAVEALEYRKNPNNYVSPINRFTGRALSYNIPFFRGGQADLTASESRADPTPALQSQIAQESLGFFSKQARGRFGEAGVDALRQNVIEIRAANKEWSDTVVITEAYNHLLETVKKNGIEAIVAGLRDAKVQASALLSELERFREGRLADLSMSLSGQQDASESLLNRHRSPDELRSKLLSDRAALRNQAGAMGLGNVTGPFTLEQTEGALARGVSLSKEHEVLLGKIADKDRAILEIDMKRSEQLAEQNRTLFARFNGIDSLAEQGRQLDAMKAALDIRRTGVVPATLSQKQFNDVAGTGLVKPDVIAEEQKRRTIEMARQLRGNAFANELDALPITSPIAAFESQANAIIDAFKRNQEAFIDGINAKIQPLTRSIEEAALTSADLFVRTVADTLNLEITIDPDALKLVMQLDPNDKRTLQQLTDEIREQLKKKITGKERAAGANRAFGATP